MKAAMHRRRPRSGPAHAASRLIAIVLIAAAGTFAAVPAQAQQLTAERIFGSDEFSPESLGQLAWMNDGERFTYLEENEETGASDLWAEHIATEERTRLLDGSELVAAGEVEPMDIDGYEWSEDEDKLLIFTDAQRVWRQATKGIFYVYDLSTGELTPVSEGEGWQQFAKFSPDGTRVGFVRENDIFFTDLATGEETRLTDDGGEDIINGTFDWVYEEEFGQRDGWRWSPDGERIAFWRLDQSPIATFAMQDMSTLYPTMVPVRYPKAGEENSEVRIGVVEVDDGEITWMDTGEDPDIYIARMGWAASSTEVGMQRLNRHQNRLELMLADARTGESRVIMTDSDSAWVDVDDDLTWLGDGDRFVWTSESDGYNHLYLYRRDGELVRQLTEGPWEVTSYHGLDEEAGWIYFTATEQGPLQRHLYRVPVSGGAPERLTEEEGTHSVTFSPGHRFFIDSYSSAGVPAETRLHRADGELVRVLVENDELAATLDGMRLQQPEFFTFETDDGVTLNGWTIRPPDFDPQREYPVLMYVYGGPGSQTVTDAWWGNRYLWHQLLAERGYIVASVDNRGTGARGRDFKKITYLNLGDYETRDQLSAARHMASLPHVDEDRVGIWGWSYGGYMTLLALLQPDNPYRAGVSVAPVTAWRLYDTIYTERFMRTPEENPEGYDDFAPINLAENLESDLLLIHGTGDDNVHYQQSVQMVDALIDADKQFDFMMYPNRTHGIGGGNTQVHLYTMMTDWVLENL